MNYPKFFNEIETIKIKDDLSNVLGVFENGDIEFSYLDVVKSAGHSCPTIAGVYLMLKEGLKEFNDPKRGEIQAFLKEDIGEGVAGAISNVIAQITGATDKSGFHGIAGKFDRRALMHFNADINSSMKLVDNISGKSVEINYNPSSIAPDKNMNILMQKVMQNEASKEEKKEFGTLWQDRVKRILLGVDKVIIVIIV